MVVLITPIDGEAHGGGSGDANGGVAVRVVMLVK